MELAVLASLLIKPFLSNNRNNSKASVSCSVPVHNSATSWFTEQWRVEDLTYVQSMFWGLEAVEYRPVMFATLRQQGPGLLISF